MLDEMKEQCKAENPNFSGIVCRNLSKKKRKTKMIYYQSNQCQIAAQ